MIIAGARRWGASAGALPVGAACALALGLLMQGLLPLLHPPHATPHTSPQAVHVAAYHSSSDCTQSELPARERDEHDESTCPVCHLMQAARHSLAFVPLEASALIAPVAAGLAAAADPALAAARIPRGARTTRGPPPMI